MRSPSVAFLFFSLDLVITLPHHLPKTQQHSILLQAQAKNCTLFRDQAKNPRTFLKRVGYQRPGIKASLQTSKTPASAWALKRPGIDGRDVRSYQSAWVIKHPGMRFLFFEAMICSEHTRLHAVVVVDGEGLWVLFLRLGRWLGFWRLCSFIPTKALSFFFINTCVFCHSDL